MCLECMGFATILVRLCGDLRVRLKALADPVATNSNFFRNNRLY